MKQLVNEFLQYYSAQSGNKFPKKINEQFEIIECLFSNETKEVFIIRDLGSGKKYILRQLAKQHHVLSTVEREILGCLDHPGIPKAVAFLEDEQYTYLIREYFEGITLETLVSRDGPLTGELIKSIGIQLCELLAYLHSHKPPVIHRDIKPQNIIFRPDGSIGLIDFDSSRLYDPNADKDTVYLGTRQTAAPEQYGYAQTDRHTDIYSLGILLIFLATGSYNRSALDAMPVRLRNIASKCTQFNPKDRYSSAIEVKKQLLAKYGGTLTVKILTGFVLGILLLAISIGAYYLSRQMVASSSASIDAPASAGTIAENTASSSTATMASTLAAATAATSESTAPSSAAETTATTTTTTASTSTATAPSTAAATTASATAATTASTSAPTTAAASVPVTASTTLGKPSEVVFDSPPIEHAVRLAIGKTNREPLYQTDLGRLTALYIVADSPTPVFPQDIQHDYYSQIIKVNNKEVKRGNVTSLSDLSKLPSLRSLTLVYQQITDLSGIENLQLQTLYVGYNQISDLTPIKNMNSLKQLSIICNPIEDLTPLKGLSRLDYLQLCGTKVTDLTPITSLNSLTGIDVFAMTWLDLSPLDEMKNLKNIWK